MTCSHASPNPECGGRNRDFERFSKLEETSPEMAELVKRAREIYNNSSL